AWPYARLPRAGHVAALDLGSLGHHYPAAARVGHAHASADRDFLSSHRALRHETSLFRLARSRANKRRASFEVSAGLPHTTRLPDTRADLFRGFARANVRL